MILRNKYGCQIENICQSDLTIDVHPLCSKMDLYKKWEVCGFGGVADTNNNQKSLQSWGYRSQILPNVNMQKLVNVVCVCFVYNLKFVV